ncbi:hypothetical protein A2U01_0095726, partial [Trifolium medium]|nr:hypothetical protein [Trifolium medium]
MQHAGHNRLWHGRAMPRMVVPESSVARSSKILIMGCTRPVQGWARAWQLK